MARSGPAVIVVAVHALILYGLIVSTGIIKMPRLALPAQLTFIEDQPESKPEPQVQIKPEIDTPIAVDQPPPEVQFEEPVVPPTDIPAPASSNAITGTTQAAAVAQDLKTSSRIEPMYPPASRRAGEQGTVRVKVLVDERGRPQTVEVSQSSGFAKLDQAAVDAVRKWRFVAATNGTSPVRAWTQVAVTFRLTDAKA